MEHRMAMAHLVGLGVVAMAAAATPMAVAEASGVALGPQPVHVALPLPADRTARVAGRHLKLELTALSARAQPGVLYRVTLEGSGQPLGYLNFLNVVTGGPASFSFDLDPSVVARAGPSLAVVIAPQGAPDPAAHPVVGKIAVTAY
jgi:hypothetical protein